MAQLTTAVRHYRRQQRVAASAVATARGAWRLLDRDALEATMPRLLARLLPVVTTAQLDAAAAGAGYAAAALAEQGLQVEPIGELDPAQLAGVASDGRPLETLLRSPVVAVRQLLGGGMPAAAAMRAGRFRLERIVYTQAADAGRVATGVAVAARPRVGYVRQPVAPSCSRCVILAGRVYRWNAGFQRHPLCDCVHIPTSEGTAGDFALDPRGYFDSLSEAEQDRVFGRAGAQAIRDGADMAQVVNARRGMRSASVFGRQALITLEGTTVRGQAGQRLAAEGARLSGESAETVRRISTTGEVQRTVIRRRVQIPRLMPEQIYQDATSRADAIRLLRRFGYIR